MSEPIKVGDLVVVVRLRSCCGTGRTGTIFKVDNLYQGRMSCLGCTTMRDDGVLARRTGDFNGYEISRLKRIPPLDELEGVLAQREITNPVTGKKEIA